MVKKNLLVKACVLLLAGLFAFNTIVSIEYITDDKQQETTTAAETTTEAELFQYIGEFTITAYCPCSKCCGKCDGITATGTKATAGRTIAVDPSVIPYGTRLYINGNIYTAEDCGGAIKGQTVDIFFNTHSEAKEFGVQTMDVYMLNEEAFALNVAD
jgi:3D (Asp-Asp-Asp) domain-containing protein